MLLCNVHKTHAAINLEHLAKESARAFVDDRLTTVDFGIVIWHVGLSFERIG